MKTSIEFTRDGFKKVITFEPKNVFYFSSTAKPDILNDLIDFVKYVGNDSEYYIYSVGKESMNNIISFCKPIEETELDFLRNFFRKHGFGNVEFVLNIETKLVFAL